MDLLKLDLTMSSQIHIPSHKTRSPFPNHSPPTQRISIPISISLSIPFFSRSTSSSTSTTTTSSDTYTTYTSTSFGDETETEMETDLEGISPPIPYTPHKQDSTDSEAGVGVDRLYTSGGDGKLTLRRSGGSRPSLRKMPSWTSWTSRSSEDGEDTGIDEVFDDGDVEVVIDGGDRAHRQRESRLHLDIGTWGRTPKVILKNCHTHTRNHTQDLKLGSPRLKDSRTHSPKVIQKTQFLANGTMHPSEVDLVDGNPSTAMPLFMAGTKQSNDEIDIAIEDKLRRGSDWPPTVARTMRLDLSGIPTFADEIMSPERIDHPYDRKDDQNSDHEPTERKCPDQGPPYPALHVGLVQSKAAMSSRGFTRVDTPLYMPMGRRLDLKLCDINSASLAEADEEEVDIKRNAVNVELGKNDSRCESKGNAMATEGADLERADEDEEDEEFFTPVPVSASVFLSHSSFPSRSRPTSKFNPRPARDTRFEDASQDTSPTFDLSIFSPRPNLPRAPVIRGILDHQFDAPISPLELPILRTARSRDLDSLPTPILPRNAPCSPVDKSSFVPDIRAVLPSPYGLRRKQVGNQSLRVPPKRVWGSISSVLSPPSENAPQRDIGEKTPPPSHSPPHKPLMRASTTARRPSLQSGGARPTRANSIAGFPIAGNGSFNSRRRMSLILRPEILPCPTPPSLLSSPKSLGNGYFPSVSVFSPPSPISSRFPKSNGGLPTRRGRGSMRLSLGNGLISPRCQADQGQTINVEQNAKREVNTHAMAGLGVGPIEETNNGEEHVATPGTFGLDGEAERLVNAGLNPYFA
ncbi:hypothetical protein IAR55_006766 [Kwoniella newhampshirensis]|uniref:Uncharacterized protein n=1 Tax=Kwoniella newhampshirensis TaxID=1651941 RepID=A0AAW0YTN4_9TREE